MNHVIYLIGSLRNKAIPHIANHFRKELGCEVFDDWFAAGPIADDSWQEFEKIRGTPYPQALKNWAATHVFNFDKTHLERSSIVILALPAGKSGHLELGWALGRGKPGYVLFDGEPERWDQMYQFANGVFYDKRDLAAHIKKAHFTE